MWDYRIFCNICCGYSLNCLRKAILMNTIMILSFRTDMSGKKVQTQIRLLVEEQSDQVYTVCHSVCIFWMHYSMVKQPCSNFWMITANFGMSEPWGVLRYSQNICFGEICKIIPKLSSNNHLICYRKFPKYSDTQNICCNYPKSWTRWHFLRCRGNCKQCRPWSDCSSRSSLIWVCSVCPDLSVWKLRNITVLSYIY